MKAAVLRFSRAALRPCTSRNLVGRSYTSTESSPERRVAILGAAGGIGQPLALLMKLNPVVSSLSLYDIANTPGVAADVAGYTREEQLDEALDGSDIVIIPAGVPRKPGMTRDDIFKINAGIALVNMISTPVNSTVPIAAEVLKKAGTFDEVNVPVVGLNLCCVELYHHAAPKSNNLSDEDMKALTKRAQDGGTEAVEAKAGKGLATLSMA
ncbi:malate dehydrogenase [Salix purpurea]|uniref:malate dehydrogenase n=1 Tax=Salix purpurea TaxID=77065 RepID=A0A9Q1AD82_SALPP|nr:malate dehydrogenase [Salix purpurea]